MSETKSEAPVVARYKPYYCELEQGRVYLWCACGRSATQPFCDGSHRGTSFRPLRIAGRETGEEVLFCGCKHTKTPPFCDGTHNNLRDTYDEDDPESPENRAIPEVGFGEDGKARLDGGCFVGRIEALRTEGVDGLTWAAVITAADGARYQSQFYFELAVPRGPVVSFGESHVALLVASGRGTLAIGPRTFALGPHVGAYVRPGESFRLACEGEEPLRVYAAVCPQAAAPVFGGPAPESFDDAFPERVVRIDPSRRRAMADRFFQLLVDRSVGSDVVTQFIGEIPLSKAAPHRHLYEESIVILRGRGFMWTESKKAPVAPGDAIFLPRKQLHSLQCTDPGGMMLAGVIYPGDNPSINY